jgi:hypothetical protein
VGELREYAAARQIAVPERAQRADLIAAIYAAFQQDFYIPPPPATAPRAARATEVDLISSAREMTRQLDRIFDDAALPRITHVYIENQISTLAARMKTIQGMITQYFVSRDPTATIHIKYISASNKLRGIVSKKSTYSERKKTSIEFCHNYLLENTHTEVRQWVDFFARFGAKRDDLADALLQIRGEPLCAAQN